MENIEERPATSNDSPLLESHFALTQAEMEEYRTLPKEEQKERRQELLTKLKTRQKELDRAIQEAYKSGNLEEAKRLLEEQKKEVEEVESLLGPDINRDLNIEALKAEFAPFLKETYKFWGVNEEKLNKAQFTPQFITPKEENYKARKADINESKFGEFTLNSETQGLNWEALKDKIFIPDLSALEGKTLQKVAEYLAANYSDKYKLPGIEFWKFMIENPDKVPHQLKDGNLYFNFGSIVRGFAGHWGVPFVRWLGAEWHRRVYWLAGDWDSNYRVVLLER